MKQVLRFHNSASWMGALLVLAAVLALAACDNDIDITGPEIPIIPPPAGVVWVAGTLTATSEGGACLEARLLYDGTSIGRSYCKGDGEGENCAELKLQGFKEKRAGHHTLELRVERQSPAEVVYRAELELRSTPSGQPYQRLGPATEALREGQSVSFVFDVP